MKRRIALWAASLAVFACSSVQAEEAGFSGNYQNNRQPLLQKEYIELPLGTIRAKGWMEDQLLRMKKGMTGHLDQVYEQVMSAAVD